MTFPPEFLAAWQMASVSAVTPSFWKGAVTLGVGVGGPHYRHINGDCLVEKPLPSTNLDQLYQRTCLSGLLVEHSALQPGIRKGLQPYMGDYTRLSGGDVAEHVGDYALGIVIGGAFVFQRQLLEPGYQPPVSADDPLPQPLFPQVVKAFSAGVALACRIDNGERFGGSGI